MSLCRTRRVHDTLQLQRGDDILTLRISILIIFIKLNHIEAGRYHDRTVFLCNDLILLLVIDCTRLAYLGADAAFSGLKLRAVLAVNDRHIRDCLCKRRIDRSTAAKPAVELAWNLFIWALFLTNAAARTLTHIDASRFFTDIDREIAHKAADMLHLAVRIKRDVWMCVCLYHLRCQDTGRAVQRRKCLIQLGHPSSDARSFLYDIDRIACLCDVKRGLNSGDTTADDERTLRDEALTRLKRGVQIHLCNGCPHQNHSLLRCLLHILVDPGAVLTDICDLHHVWVQSGSFSCFSECCLMHTWRA